MDFVTNIIDIIITNFDLYENYEEFINKNLDLIILEFPGIDEAVLLNTIILLFSIIENLEASKKKNRSIILNLYESFNLKVEKEIQEEIVFKNLDKNINENYIKYLRKKGLIGIANLALLCNNDKIAHIPRVEDTSGDTVDISFDFYRNYFSENRNRIIRDNLYPEYGNLIFNYVAKNFSSDNNVEKNNVSILLPSKVNNMYISNNFYKELLYLGKKYSISNITDIFNDFLSLKESFVTTYPLDFNIDYDFSIRKRRRLDFNVTEEKYNDLIKRETKPITRIMCEHEIALENLIKLNYDNLVLEEFLGKFIFYDNENPICKACGTIINDIAKEQIMTEGSSDLLIINNTSKLIIRQLPYSNFVQVYISLEEILKNLDLYFGSFSVIDLIHIFRIYIDNMIAINDNRKLLEKTYSKEIENNDLFLVRIKEKDNFLEIYKNEKFIELKVLNNYIFILIIYTMILPPSSLYYIKKNIFKKDGDIDAKDFLLYMTRYLSYQKIYSKHLRELINIYLEISTDELKKIYLSFQKRISLLQTLNNPFEKKLKSIQELKLNKNLPIFNYKIDYVNKTNTLSKNFDYYIGSYNAFENVLDNYVDSDIKIEFPKTINFNFPKEFYYNGEKINKLVIQDNNYFIHIKTRIYPIIKSYLEIVEEYNLFSTTDDYINKINGNDCLWFTPNLSLDHICRIENQDIFNLYNYNNHEGIMDRSIINTFFIKKFNY